MSTVTAKDCIGFEDNQKILDTSCSTYLASTKETRLLSDILRFTPFLPKVSSIPTNTDNRPLFMQTMRQSRLNKLHVSELQLELTT